MIIQHTPNQPGLMLKSDLAGEFPLYLYWPQDQSTLLYSKSITELIKDTRIPKPLKLSTEGLSFLLQSGVVAPPKTAYQDIYILGIGDKAKISTVNGKIDIQFSYDFPFLNANRLQAGEMQPDEDLILQMLAEATINRIDESKPSFLFHSAGKDSNSIALALAEAGWQNKVTLISYKADGKLDESEISAKIAKQLGFKHKVLHRVNQFQPQHKQAIRDFFVNTPFPCTDIASFGYPLYTLQLPELKGANIIDGSGNDVFIGYMPSSSEFKYQQISKYLKHTYVLSKFFPSESLFHVAGRTRAEWTGLSGLSFTDSKKILLDAFEVHDFWLLIDTNQDYLDLRALIRGTIIEQDIFLRKVRNFCDAVHSNMILPWANQRVAEYFSKMPEQYLFDRKTLKNKLVLRKILKDRIGLDSDKLGKMGMGWSSNASSIVLNNWDWMLQEMQQCTLWNKTGLVKVVKRMKNSMNGTGWGAGAAGRLISKIYLLSAWYNQTKFK